MTDVLAQYRQGDMQAVYDRQRHTAPYVLVRVTFLKCGRSIIDEVWWDTEKICEALAADEPTSGKIKPEDIEHIFWRVVSRRDHERSLAVAEQIERGSSRVH